MAESKHATENLIGVLGSFVGVIINKTRSRYMFIMIVLIDVIASVLIPVYYRKVNSETRGLRMCEGESGFNRFSNDPSCQGFEHKISILAVLLYGMSILLSILLLIISMETSYQSNALSVILDSSKIVIIFAIRNVAMFNMMNYMSDRDGDKVIVQAVKMETITMISSILISLIISALLMVIFPYDLLRGYKKSKTIRLVIYMSWFILTESLIYYIGITNVLNKNVLSMYDIRGPELLTLNYWNYGILTLIYCEYVLLYKLYLKFNSSNHGSLELSNIIEA
jgi:hypothetical protein